MASRSCAWDHHSRGREKKAFCLLGLRGLRDCNGAKKAATAQSLRDGGKNQSGRRAAPLALSKLLEVTIGCSACVHRREPIGSRHKILFSRYFASILRKRPCFLPMLRLQRIVPRHPKPGHPNVPNRHPTLQFVMPGSMKNVRDAHRGRRPRRLQTCERGGVVDHVIGQQNLLPPARLKISRGGIIQSAKHGDAGKQEHVLPIPEAMHGNRCRRNSHRRLLRGRAQGQHQEQRNGLEAGSHPSILPSRSRPAKYGRIFRGIAADPFRTDLCSRPDLLGG